MDEQADDAAGLIRALDLAPAVVFGTSGGAVILLNLLLSWVARVLERRMSRATKLAVSKDKLRELPTGEVGQTVVPEADTRT